MIDLGAGSAFSAINSCFMLADFVIAVREVGSENEVFVRTIQRVRLDLEEIERLMRIPSVKLVLSKSPGQLEYIKHAIHTTKNALNEIGLYVERVRSDNDRDGEISFAHKVRWVLKDHGKLENRRSELAACHQALTTVLGTLHPIELAGGLAATDSQSAVQDVPPPVYDNSMEESFLGPNQRRKRKSKFGVDVAISEVKTENEKVGRILLPQDLENIDPKLEWPCTQIKVAGEFDRSRQQQSIMPKPTNRVLLPAPSFTSSNYSSFSSNNFGPVNPWDDWNSDTAKEVQGGGKVANMTTIDSWSASSDITAFLNTMLPLGEQHQPIVPPKIPFRHNFDGKNAGTEGNSFPFPSEEQARSWVTAREPAISYPTAEPEFDSVAELSSGIIAEVPARKPIPTRTESEPWNQRKTGDPTSDIATVQAQYGPNLVTSCYGRPHSIPSVTNWSTATLPETNGDPYQMGATRTAEKERRPFGAAGEPLRPRAQTNLHIREIPSINRPGSASSALLSSHCASTNAPSPTPSFVSSIAPDDDDGASIRQQEYVGSNRVSNIDSRSRRRRAMMEAAVGVHGD